MFLELVGQVPVFYFNLRHLPVDFNQLQTQLVLQWSGLALTFRYSSVLVPVGSGWIVPRRGLGKGEFCRGVLLILLLFMSTPHGTGLLDIWSG